LVFDSRMNLVSHCRLVPRVLVCFALLAAACLHGQVPEVKAKRTFTHGRDIATAYVWRHFPRWDGKLLVGYDNNSSRSPIIYTIDRDGRREETLFTLDGGAQIDIHDIAASADGEIAIVGDAVTSDRRGSTFVARIAIDRHSQIVTRTWPFHPLVVTFAPDGAVWTIGNLKDQDARDIANNVIRRFDRTGRMLGSTTLQTRGFQTAATSFLSASRDRVGWFTLHGEYIEFSLDGSEIARYDGPDGDDASDISGVALNEENDVVAGRFGKGKAEFVVLDREKRTWTAVSLPNEYAPTWARVLGFDGTTLVTYSENGKLRRFQTKRGFVE
jgi:hypothetical protein